MKSLSAPLVLVLVLTVVVAAAARSYRPRKVSLQGRWNPITNVEDPQVQEMGKFAVAEYNKQSEEAVEFVAVVSGEFQVVAGRNYRLVVEGNNGGVVAKYQAVVYERPWENFKKLTSFELIAD